MTKKVVTFGEIMLRLSPPGFQRFIQARSFDAIYGGGEANVAASLANYGLPVEYVTRLPANDIGDACLNFLRQYGVGTNHIVRGGERLGIYFLEMGSAQRGSKVIYDRAGSAIALHERHHTHSQVRSLLGPWSPGHTAAPLHVAARVPLSIRPGREGDDCWAGPARARGLATTLGAAN